MKPNANSRLLRSVAVALLFALAGGLQAPRPACADDFERLRGLKIPRWHGEPRVACPSPAPLSDIGRIPGQPGSLPPRIPQHRAPCAEGPTPSRLGASAAPRQAWLGGIVSGRDGCDWLWMLGWVRF